jgi:sugar lactone lactonase YvrE
MPFQVCRIPPGPPAFVGFPEFSAVDPTTGRTLMHLAVVVLGTGCTPPGPGDPTIRLRVGSEAGSDLVLGQTVRIDGPTATAGLATLSGSGVQLIEIELVSSQGDWAIQLGGHAGGTFVAADTAAQTRQAWIDAPSSLALEAESGQTVSGIALIANRGTCPLKIDNANGALGAGFTLADVDPRSVAPNRCAEARVTFSAPAGAGVSEGVLQLRTNDPSPSTVPPHNATVALTATVRRPLWISGDVLVSDVNADSTSGVIYRVSPSLGQSVLSAAGHLVFPLGMAFDPDGNLLVADSGTEGTPGRLVRIDRFTGAQSILSSGGSFNAPAGVVVAADGTVVVADAGPFNESGSVIKVDPRTGTQTVVSAGNLLSTPCDLVLQGDAIVVLCGGDAFGGAGKIIAVDAGGGQRIVASKGTFQDPSLRPHALAKEPAGTLLVAETHGTTGGVIRINPTTGAQQTLADPPLRLRVFGIATSTSGRILICATPAIGPSTPPGRGIFELDPVNGQPIPVSLDGLFGGPERLVIAP